MDNKNNEVKHSNLIFLRLISLIVTLAAMIASVGVTFSGQEKRLLSLLPIPMALIALSSVLLLMVLFLKKKEPRTSPMDELKEVKESINQLKRDIKKCKSVGKKGSVDIDRLAVLSKVKRSGGNISQRYLRIQEECNLMKLVAFSAMIAFASAGLAPLILVIISSFVMPDNSQNAITSIPQIISTKWNFIALAMVSEIVAGMFMKVYFKLLEDAKHYNDEYTVLSKNIISLITLILLERDEGVQEVLLKMLEHKSNRILKKGEITEDVLREQNSNTLSELGEILKILGPVVKIKGE